MVRMRLKATSAEDFVALRHLFDGPSFHGWGAPGRLPDELIRARYLGSRLPRVECFLVLVDEMAVGLVQLHTDDAGSGGLDLIMLPEARSQGIGRRAVAAIVARAREKGMTTLTVDPDLHNERGIRFWQAVGFEPQATVREEAGREPYLLMRRHVDASTQ